VLEAAGITETSVRFYQTTLLNIREGSHLQYRISPSCVQGVCVCDGDFVMRVADNKIKRHLWSLSVIHYCWGEQ